MKNHSYKMSYTFSQPYHGWATVPTVDLTQPTKCILAALDSLEKEVYRDRDYTQVNEMINEIRKSRAD